MESIGQKHLPGHPNSVKDLILKNVVNMEFVFSVIVPIAVFYAFSRYNRVLTGTIVAGLWSIAVVAVQFVFSKKVNVYAVIAAGFSGIGLLGTVLSQNLKFYLASPIVTDFIFALVFFGSVLWGKPLILMFAEYSVKGGFSEELRQKPNFLSAWTILTVAWGILSLTQAAVRIILLLTVSNELYFGISTLYANISSPLLLVFSFWFPGWYWKRNT